MTGEENLIDETVFTFFCQEYSKDAIIRCYHNRRNKYDIMYSDFA